MNLDYIIPSSPAVCRRLKHASEVMEISLDDKILQMAEQGLIDPQHVQNSIPGEFLTVTPTIQDFCQYVADHGYRTAVLDTDLTRLITVMLASVMISSERILIVTTSKTETTWLAALRFAGLRSWAMYDENIDHVNDRIVITRPDQMSDGFINNNRDRVVLRTVSSGAREQPHDFWTKENHPTNMIALDFPKIITGTDVGSSTTKWWDNYNVIGILEDLNDDVMWSRVFGYKNSDLHDMKFKTTDPDKIGHLYGVYTGFLKP